jgi:hypothetical protein
MAIKKKKPSIVFNGGGSLSKREHSTKHGPIKSTSFGVGGRAGVSFPAGKSTIELGVKGFFSKSKSKFSKGLQKLGAPKSKSNIGKRLTGVDASITQRGGNRFSVEFNTPSSKERSGMLRFNMKF